jgi:hypothetical protein
MKERSVAKMFLMAAPQLRRSVRLTSHSVFDVSGGRHQPGSQIGSKRAVKWRSSSGAYVMR